MLSDRIVGFLLKQGRGKDAKIASNLSSWQVLINLLQKGFWPFVRGLTMKPRLGAARGSFFLGRGCRILNKGLLRVGKKVYIGSYSYLDCLSTEGVEIGDDVTIREGCWLQLTSQYNNPGVGITIGNSVYIGPRSILGAGAKITIGDRCQLGANVSLVAENHQFDSEQAIFDQDTSRKGIDIGQDVWIGNYVIILDGVSVGDGCVIGAGTVLTRSVPPGSVVVGVPGKVIRTR